MEARFWGKIIGTGADYYVVQGYRAPVKEKTNMSLGS